MTKVKTTQLNYATLYDPLRPPAWRYERVVKLIDNNWAPHPVYDDKFILKFREYRHYKDELERRHEDEYISRHKLANKYRHLWNADRLFNEGRDSRSRWGLEAMILARMPFEAIAKSANCEVDTVRIYEKLFFNVLDRIDAKEYIASVVLHNSFMSGLPHRTAEMTAKFFAYFGGPLVLGLVLDAFDPSNHIPEEPHEISRYLDDKFRLASRTSALVGVTFLEPTNFNFRPLLESYTALLSLQYRETANAGDDNAINQAVELFARNNPVIKGDEASLVPVRPGRLIANGAIEPRVNEIFDVLQENKEADINQFPDDWTMPPPQIKVDADKTDPS